MLKKDIYEACKYVLSSIPHMLITNCSKSRIIKTITLCVVKVYIITYIEHTYL